MAIATDLDSWSTDLTRPLKTTSAPFAVIGDWHDGGEPHVVFGDGARVADPGRNEAAAQTHGQHAVGDCRVEPDLLGDLVVPVDRVQIAGDAGVVDQVARVRVTTFSGSSSPTFTELNSRRAIVEATLSVSSLPARPASCRSPGQVHHSDW